MIDISEHKKVAWQLIKQSWLPVILALMYSIWEYESISPASRTVAGFIKSVFAALFLIMWFTGQWLRTSKQINDSEKLQSIQSGVSDIQKDLDKLKHQTEKIQNSGENVQDNAVREDKDFMAFVSNDSGIDRVIAEMPQSSSAALITLTIQIEKVLRNLIWSSGWHSQQPAHSTIQAIEILVKLGVVKADIASAVRSFIAVRNKIIHGYEVKDEDILRAIDIGLEILQIIQSIPNEEKIVYHPSVIIFADPLGKNKREGFTGLVLEFIGSDNKITRHQVFPIREQEYEKGMRVSWEFDLKVVVGESWFLNPDSNCIEYAWTSSALFKGRNIALI